MGFLAPLAALLGLELETVVARTRAAAMVYGAIALLVLLALVFLTVAGYLALVDLFGGIIAALIMSGVFLLIALAIYAGAMIGRGRRRRELVEKRRSSETGALLTTAAITAIPMALRSPGLLRLGIPAAAIAAVALLRKADKD